MSKSQYTVYASLTYADTINNVLNIASQMQDLNVMYTISTVADDN